MLEYCLTNAIFTGKERDTESGLDNFGARYYASTMGGFMTPDWAARPTSVPYAVFGDPQSLNLYGYVRNDPVTLADADGHDPPVPVGPLEDNSGTTYNEERAQTLTGKGEKAAEVATAAAPALVEGGEAALAAAANKLLTAAVDFLGVLVDAASVPAMVLLTPTQLNSDENAQMAKIHAAEDNASGALPKPPTGPGSVPPDQRDPQRVARPGAKADKLAGQGGACANCGAQVKAGKGIGHHPVRHADGGRTKDVVIVCEGCHKDLHSGSN